MTVTIRNRTSGRDPVARSHRRSAFWRRCLLFAGGAAILAGVAWLLLFSTVFSIFDIQIRGSRTLSTDRMREVVASFLQERRFGLHSPSRNIVFLNEQGVADALHMGFENIASVSVEKLYPHGIIVTVTERTPIGIWCVQIHCRYFDSQGTLWGSTLPSRGPLLLLVTDERIDAAPDPRVFRGLTAAVSGLPQLGLHASSVTLPDAAPGDLRIMTDKHYQLILDSLGDIPDQLSTLGVLLADRAKDSGWAPQYIDLRTPGRAYYR